MRKILLIAINSSWSQSNPALYYLREVISDLPYQVQICDFTLKDHLTDIMQGICAQKPDILCFSAYIWNRLLLQNLVPELKKLLPQACVVIGGPEAANADFGLGKQDSIVVGSGEGAFRALAKADFAPGAEHLAQAIALRDLPLPYTLADAGSLQGKLLYYECYRGCPYSCVYCLSALDKRCELRFDPESSEDMSRMLAELEILKALQPKTLKFVDRSFNSHGKFARLVWDYFISTDWPGDVHFEIYPDLLEEEDFRILEKAAVGRIRFEIGIQTTNPEVSKACGRFTSWDKAKTALTELKQRTKLRIHADLIAGLPSENLASVLNSVNELCATLPDAVQLGTLKILPDTPMLQIALSRGYLWLNNPPYQCLASDALSFSDMCYLDSLAHLLNLYWNKEEFAPLWEALLAIHKATEILQALLELHQELGYETHSVSKGKREAVMAIIKGKFLPTE